MNDDQKIIAFHSCIDWLEQTQTWIYNQILHLPPVIENYVLCERTQNLEQFKLPNIYSLCQRSQLSCMFRKACRKLNIRHNPGYFNQQLKDNQAQLIHSHFGYKGWEDNKLAQQHKLKHVVTFYGVDVTHFPQKNPAWLNRYQKLFSQVDLVLCEGPFMANSVKQLGCLAEKVKVHHLGVSVSQYPFKPKPWKRSEPLQILIAAAFREKKGIPYALQALGKLQHEVDLKITIIGDASKNSPASKLEKRQILQLIEEYNLQSKTQLLGFQPYQVLLEQMYQNHILLSPSVTAKDGDTEGGAPVTIIEAAAIGLLVVSAHHCDIPEVIHHKKMGLLAQERNVEDLYQQLHWLIEHPQEWSRMREAARAHIEAEFDARVQGKRLAEIYQSLISRKAIN